MKTFSLLMLIGSLLMAAPSIYDFEVVDIHHQPVSMASFKGKVLLIVNTASRCGFTPQFEGLEKLYKTYHDRGFEVLGFPCNQFASQEPLNEAQIESFCQLDYGVTFPMFAKIEVNGDNTHPLYRFLKAQATGLLGSESIKWNFTKFLIDRNGTVIERFAPATTPESIEESIKNLL